MTYVDDNTWLSDLPLPVTLARALALPVQLTTGRVTSYLLITEAERKAAERAWLRLRGSAPDDDSVASSEGAKAGAEDAQLLLSQSRAAVEFRDWFKKQDWSVWPVSEQGDGKDWPFDVQHQANHIMRVVGWSASHATIRA